LQLAGPHPTDNATLLITSREISSWQTPNRFTENRQNIRIKKNVVIRYKMSIEGYSPDTIAARHDCRLILDASSRFHLVCFLYSAILKEAKKGNQSGNTEEITQVRQKKG
jgi:hypothetical protein